MHFPSILLCRPGHHPRYPAQARFLGVDVLPIGVEFEGCPFDVVLVARRDIYGPMQTKIASQCPGGWVGAGGSPPCTALGRRCVFDLQTVCVCVLCWDR